ncbi:hypothetical protein CL633_02275 [bacterium]|nr:hypothetical protein [bacterium]|tara:strand:- start:6960 stop:7208 length:249 start_codon:yes stop_codon:yes gene_type:complete
MLKNSKQKIRVLKIFCQKCKAHLYKYHKQGAGKLIKCYKDMIIRDFTNNDLKCQECGQQFARHAIIHNRPSNKIISGKVFVR